MKIYFFLIISFLSGCSDENLADRRVVEILRKGYGDYELYFLVWIVFLFIVCRILSERYKNIVERSVGFTAYYVITNYFSYLTLSRLDGVDHYGVYFSTALSVFIVLLATVVLKNVAIHIKQKIWDAKRVLTDFCLLLLVMSFGSWVAVTYRLGSGECLDIGRSLTPYEIYEEVAKEIGGIDVSTLVEINYKRFVEEYQMGNYSEAMLKLPYFDRAPDGFFYMYYDDFVDRVIQGRSYAEIYVEEPLRNRTITLSHAIGNCGEVQLIGRKYGGDTVRKKYWSN